MSSSHEFKPVTLKGQENFTRWNRKFQIAAQAQGVWCLFTDTVILAQLDSKDANLELMRVCKRVSRLMLQSE
jgi:hypothetical protein